MGSASNGRGWADSIGTRKGSSISSGFRGAPKIFSVSRIFWENLAKSYVGAPPTGNPGSATEVCILLECFLLAKYIFPIRPRVEVSTNKIA